MIAPSAVESMKSTSVRSSTTHGSAPAVAIDSTVASRGAAARSSSPRAVTSSAPSTGSKSTV